MNAPVNTVQEQAPGAAWAAHHAAHAPAFERWWLRKGGGPRPTYLACERALARHMPEILPLWETLTALAGGSDVAARTLSGFRPPPYLTGCSQAVWLRGEPLLVRNYDYVDRLWERTLLHTGWQGRTVVGMSDCLWGLLDGVNDLGLAVSLAFGGRQEVGEGFGIPIVLRYVLQTQGTVRGAVEALSRIPCHMAYTVTLLDASGAHATVFLSPGQAAVVGTQRAATNHQGAVHWAAHAFTTDSVARLERLEACLDTTGETGEDFVQHFLQPPLWSDPDGAIGGTLYTATYRPGARTLTLCWPDASSITAAAQPRPDR